MASFEGSLDPTARVVIQIVLSGPDFANFVPINAVHATMQKWLDEKL